MFLAPWPHRVTVQKPSTSKDNEGGSVPAWTTRQAGVHCLIGGVGGSSGERFDQQPLASSLTVATLYSGTQPGDRILVTTGPGTGSYARVEGIADPGPSPAGVVAPAAFYLLTCERLRT